MELKPVHIFPLPVAQCQALLVGGAGRLLEDEGVSNPGSEVFSSAGYGRIQEPAGHKSTPWLTSHDTFLGSFKGSFES